MVVIVQENPANATIAISGNLKAGSCFDPEDKSGTAELTAEMVQRGTEKRSALQIAQESEYEMCIRDSPYKWPLLFLIASAFWNFLGGGVFGFMINLPIINYYEHATYLTSNHGHTALFGTYGMLAIALALFVWRGIVDVYKRQEGMLGRAGNGCPLALIKSTDGGGQWKSVNRAMSPSKETWQDLFPEY